MSDKSLCHFMLRMLKIDTSLIVYFWLTSKMAVNMVKLKNHPKLCVVSLWCMASCNDRAMTVILKYFESQLIFNMTNHLLKMKLDPNAGREGRKLMQVSICNGSAMAVFLVFLVMTDIQDVWKHFKGWIKIIIIIISDLQMQVSTF